MKLSLGTDALHGCASDQCDQYDMGCGATYGIRIIDADDLDQLGVDGGSIDPLASACMHVPPPPPSPP
ncbi:MAG TPA: hypothetical protein VL172_13750, partial [Kofleriaceae bacterium]|nr:hypothetical protein [Kofleriaceae bacterium]